MNESQDSESVQVGDLVSVFKRGRVWHANYQLDGRQQRVSLKTKVKKGALKKATELEIQLQEGSLPRKVAKVPLEQLREEYIANLENLERASSTVSHNKTALNQFVAFAAEKKARYIAQVNLALIDAFRDELRARALAKRQTSANKTNNFQKTISFKLTVVRSLVLFALRKNYLHTDPVIGLRIEKPKTPRQPCWTWDEVEQILNTTPRNLAPLFTTLAQTGMRIGEALHLEWTDLDFQNGFIHIQAKPDWKPKTGENRMVPMGDAVREQLRHIPKTQRWVFARVNNERTQVPCAARTAANHALQGLKEVLVLLNLQGKLHTFRHSFVSHALISGTPEAVVREWVGHMDSEMTREYTQIANRISKSQMNQLFGTVSKA